MSEVIRVKSVFVSSEIGQDHSVQLHRLLIAQNVPVKRAEVGDGVGVEIQPLFQNPRAWSIRRVLPFLFEQRFHESH